jgi:hypothetical protein
MSDGHPDAVDLTLNEEIEEQQDHEPWPTVEGGDEDIVTGLSRMELRPPGPPSSEPRFPELEKPASSIRPLKERETRKPTSLVDLPVDVLKDIVKEVSELDIPGCLRGSALHGARPFEMDRHLPVHSFLAFSSAFSSTPWLILLRLHTQTI